ncbi:MAG TPA: protein kinase [Acidimicrobiia bacterium]|jgi:serine/threonine protein kinase|nr:protein kinase [Acidimicrobiia bacterium]
MPEPGDLVGPYRFVSQLGRGAMGEVWRARDERLDRYVALKVVPADLDADLERRVRMLREARAAAAIRHANVVTLFDVVQHHGDDILVMELVEGRTLSELLKKDGPPPLAQALAWIEGVADALAAAHARGILHRDIKAANVMITSEGGVKVLDFGLAKLRDGDAAPASGTPPPARASMPSTSETRIALDETMPSQSRPMAAVAARAHGSPSAEDVASYRTHAGQLLGTPLYMAPEQIGGDLPDERSEVFSLGVLAFEVLAGKPPYNATTLDELFAQIASAPTPALDRTRVPASVVAIVDRALAKERDDRWPAMAALRDAVAAERARLFAPRGRRWPLVAAGAAAIAAAVIAGVSMWGTHGGPAPDKPGDSYVSRALEEYDVFYNDKALSSLRAALAVAPDHARANAYIILFNGSEVDRAAAVAGAQRARPATEAGSKDRALIDAALALASGGPAAARAAIAASGATVDRELAFWTAELDYRAGAYAAADDEYRALLADPALQFRGRIYDHESSVLLYLDRPDEALAIGRLYRDAFPGEADAVGVYATTLAAAGRYGEAVAAAEDALRLNEGEDTLAGLAKVLALKALGDGESSGSGVSGGSDDFARAEGLYQRSIDRAGPNRRPLRRAALALLQWIAGDAATAQATVAPCLPGGADAAARERGACLFVAGVVDTTAAETAARELDHLAADSTPLHPAYGAPASLAMLVRARASFFAGACVGHGDRDTATAAAAVDGRAFDAPVDFYASYHLPFFVTYAACERAAWLAARGDRAGAVAVLAPIVARAQHRAWIEHALAEDR